MSRSALIVCLTAAVASVGCSAIAAIAGAPKIVSVTVTAPAGLLVGDSAQASSNALGDDGKTHNGRPVTWRSSDPAALPIDAQGKMVALIGGRTVTITAEVEGKTGSATVRIGSDDARFAYALADQPTASGPYAPDPAYRYNSSGGAISVTRASTGVYSMRFGGLGRQPGQRDNVQVSTYGSVAAYCKVDVWTTSGADLVVPVVCFDLNGNPADSRFTVMALGAWAFGKTAPLAFALYQPDTAMFVALDTSATARNSTGGHIGVAHPSEGVFSVGFSGLEPLWLAAPAAVQVSAVGTGLRRCRLTAYDQAHAGLEVRCTRLGGGPGDAPWSLLWLQHGRPSMRFAFAWLTSASQTTDYTPLADFLINSSGGSAKARKTALGQYHVVFAGLGRPGGATETVLVWSLFSSTDRICDILSWGNTGANDLFVDVACYDPTGAATDTRFGVMVIQ